MKRFLALLGTVLSLLMVSLSADARDPAAKDLTQKQIDKLQSTVMNMNLPLQKRIRALKKLHWDQLDGGKINRSFCVWDPLGRNGPIYATVDDQKLRSLHYGLALDIRAYQDEDKLVADLKSGTCDAALIRGNRAYQFNRFVATLDAPGALPTVEHFRIVSQVIASPKSAARMEQGDYVVAGVAYLGDSYFIRHSRASSGFAELAKQKLGVIADEPSLVEMANQLTPTAQALSATASAEKFVNNELDALLAPAVIYHALISGQLNGPVRIMNMPQSLSTMQLIGRRDKFPTGLAQMLREDFLFKFDNYVKRVEAEVRNVPSEYWQAIPESEQKRRAKQLQALRLKLRDNGMYDAGMLRMMRKIRCKLEPQGNECLNPVE